MHAAGGMAQLHTGYRPPKKWLGQHGEFIIGLPAPLKRSLARGGLIEPADRFRERITIKARKALGYRVVDDAAMRAAIRRRG